MEIEDWHVTGVVAGGKQHWVGAVLRRYSEENEEVARCRIVCGRVTWVTLVPWEDGWHETSQACRTCASYLRQQLEAENPEPPRYTPEELAEREERLRDIRMLETLRLITAAAERPAAKQTRIAPRHELEETIRELLGDLRRARKAIRTYGEQIDKLDAENQGLRRDFVKLAEVNQEMARRVAKADVLREFVGTLYREP